jgi:hypothetical protein
LKFAARTLAQRVAAARLRALRVERSTATSAADVVAALGAVQAQDYPASLWAIGLRVPGATEATVEQAVAARAIVRTWPMRGTLHFVTAEDARWMLRLMTPRILRGAHARFSALGLDEATFKTSRRVAVKELEGGRRLARPDLYARFEAMKISTRDQRGIHIIGRLAQEGLLCFAGRDGKQPTFALLDEWVPEPRELTRDESLVEIARRYFIGHGPATLRDFVWWTGLAVAEARQGLELARPDLEAVTVAGVEHWLAPGGLDAAESEGDPGASGFHLLAAFDEYLVSYRDRDPLLEPQHQPRVWAGGMFYPPIVDRGRVLGVWKREFKKAGVAVTPTLFGELPKTKYGALRRAVKRYGEFVGRPVVG